MARKYSNFQLKGEPNIYSNIIYVTWLHVCVNLEFNIFLSEINVLVNDVGFSISEIYLHKRKWNGMGWNGLCCI